MTLMSYIYNDILLIHNDPCHAKAFEEALIAAGDGRSNFEWVRTLSIGLESLAQKGVWAIFLNLYLPDSRGLDTLDKLLSVTSTAPIVVLGGMDDEDICKAAMLHGAQDYLLEGHADSYSFARAIRNIIEREIARQELFTEKERAQVTLNSIGDAVLSTDISGNVTYLNAVAETMTVVQGGRREAARRGVSNHRRQHSGTFTESHGISSSKKQNRGTHRELHL